MVFLKKKLSHFWRFKVVCFYLSIIFLCVSLMFVTCLGNTCQTHYIMCHLTFNFSDSCYQNMLSPTTTFNCRRIYFFFFFFRLGWWSGRGVLDSAAVILRHRNTLQVLKQSAHTHIHTSSSHTPALWGYSEAPISPLLTCELNGVVRGEAVRFWHERLLDTVWCERSSSFVTINLNTWDDNSAKPSAM